MIGEQARSIRKAAGATLDDVAVEAAQWGLNWSTGRVSDIERGRGAVALETVLILCQVLGQIRGEPVRLAELLPESGTVPLAQFHPSVSAVRQAFLGQPVELTTVSPGDEVRVPGWDIKHEGHKLVATPTPTLATQRAAKTLGVSPRDVDLTSFALWGNLFEEERTKRVDDLRAIEPEGSVTPQKLGHITRDMIRELRGELADDRRVEG
jgi:transcriptional regulator with XRE-family HTH domain